MVEQRVFVFLSCQLLLQHENGYNDAYLFTLKAVWGQIKMKAAETEVGQQGRVSLLQEAQMWSLGERRQEGTG